MRTMEIKTYEMACDAPVFLYGFFVAYDENTAGERKFIDWGNCIFVRHRNGGGETFDFIVYPDQHGDLPTLDEYLDNECSNQIKQIGLDDIYNPDNLIIDNVMVYGDFSKMVENKYIPF